VCGEACASHLADAELQACVHHAVSGATTGVRHGGAFFHGHEGVTQQEQAM
jgi:hypothetical protein